MFLPLKESYSLLLKQFESLVIEKIQNNVKSEKTDVWRT